MALSRKEVSDIIARNKSRKGSEKSASPTLSGKALSGGRSISPKDMANRYH